MVIDLDKPELSTADLLACVPGLAGDLFKLWLARGHFVPREAGPGKGGRRKWAAAEVIQAAALHEAQMQNIPVSKGPPLWFMVQARLIAWLHPAPGDARDQIMLLYVNPYTGDLDARTTYESAADLGLDREDGPNVFTVFRTDRIIRLTLTRIEALLAENEIPPAPNPSAGAESLADFLLIYAEDAAGRKVRTGLTFLETAELEALDAARFLSADGFLTSDENARSRELFIKHERARCVRVAEHLRKRTGDRLAAETNDIAPSTDTAGA